jgi:hypothetical protein
MLIVGIVAGWLMLIWILESKNIKRQRKEDANAAERRAQTRAGNN